MVEVEEQPISSVWMLTREYGELAGAGGVKDVVSQLARVLARWNRRQVCVVLPCYGFINPAEHGFHRLADPLFPDRNLEYAVDMNYVALERQERVRVWHGVQERVKLYLLEAERFVEKSGIYNYTREEFQRESWKVQGSGHFDFFAMNILLQKAALDLMILLGDKPQIIHCHDGHTAVTPALMRECAGYRHYFRNTAAVVTIHNAGVGYHQEVSDLPFVQAVTGLPWQAIHDSCLGHSFDPFIAAGHYATISTVSENYAKELQETDNDYLTGWLGHRLHDRGVIIVGITNGIEPAQFDPSEPEKTNIPAGYRIDDKSDVLSGKMACKQQLLQMLAVEPGENEDNRSGYLTSDPALTLYTFIGRLSDQKGVDILAAALLLFLAQDRAAQFVCLGNGGEREEALLIDLAEDSDFLGRVCFLRGFDPELANKIYAAGDFFLIPSRYEPCGLTDFIAQLFGNLPIVHHVGGLVKVLDGQTGFAYRGNSPENCAEAMQRAFDAFADSSRIRSMQRQAIEKIARQHTWSQVMKAYIQLYKASRAEWFSHL